MSESKAQLALRFAREQKARCQTWMELHNRLYGIGGKCGELFPTQEEREEFFQSGEHLRIRELIDSLPGPESPDSNTELSERLARSNGVLSLRLPATLHAALIAEAEAEGVSLEELCQAKLSVQLKTAIQG